MSGESLELDDTITSSTWKKAYEGCRLDYPVSHGIDRSGKNKLPSSFLDVRRYESNQDDVSLRAFDLPWILFGLVLRRL